MGEPQKQSPVRALFINAMFGGFIAVVVFVVGTYWFVIPQLYHQQQRIESLEAELREHQARHEETGEEAAEEAGEMAAQVDVQPAVAAEQAEAEPAIAEEEAP